MKSQESKAAKIRQWILSGKPLTQWECTMQFRYLRLGALIHDMRKQGYQIKTELIEQDGGGAYARYSMPVNDKQQLKLFE